MMESLQKKNLIKRNKNYQKYNINQKYNVDKSILLDRFNNKYKIIIKDNLMHIYDYQKRNYKDINKYFDMGINNLRYNLEVEDE